MNNYKVKRIYESPETSDGWRVLVDRIWPRGMSKQRARLDAWWKEAAPSTALRRWFQHRPERFEEFKSRYRHELDQAAMLGLLDEIEWRGTDLEKNVTLLYAASDEIHNHAVVLKEWLIEYY